MIGGGLCLILLGVFAYLMAFKRRSYDESYPPKGAIAVGVLFFITSSIVSSSWHILNWQFQKLQQEMNRVLSVESAKISNVSFHIPPVPMGLGLSIQCVVSSASAASGGDPVPNSVGGVFPVPVSAFDSLALESGIVGNNSANMSKNDKTTAQRLQELENVKGMLSKEEYETKKSEIIASL